ncbi:MAG: hypothetical protein OXH00_25970 [Candidatus Poribacteria bacterium]|nr:hypothetical protein [Candidatus Poribacteria bacterium]
MLKEHPFLVTTTFQGDGKTIKYDITKPNRSEAVGKAFKINADGKGELVGDGDEIDGKVISVDDDHKFTGAYMFGGLNLPLGENATVARGDKIVGALGASSAKGYVKSATEPAALADIEAADFDTAAEELVVHNAARAQITNLVNALKGKGSVHNSDTTHALVALGA